MGEFASSYQLRLVMIVGEVVKVEKRIELEPLKHSEVRVKMLYAYCTGSPPAVSLAPFPLPEFVVL